MKDHRKAEIVNEMTAIAKKYAGTGQLREHIGKAVLSFIEEQDKDTRHACAAAVLQCAEDVSGECIWKYDAHAACLNAEAI